MTSSSRKKTDWTKWATIIAAVGVGVPVLLYFLSEIDPPPLEVGITGPDSSTVENEVSLVAEVNGGKPPYSYSWNFGDGPDVSNLEKPVHKYLLSDTYPISLTVTDAAGSSKTATRTITIKAHPEITVTLITPDKPIQSHQDITFTAEVNGGKPPYEYSWDFGDDSELSASERPVHRYLRGGFFPLSLTVTDDAGVSETAIKEIEVIKEPPDVKLAAPMSAGQLSEIDCAAQTPMIPGLNEPINCGYAYVAVENEGIGVATNCFLETRIIPNFAVPTLPGDDASQTVRSGTAPEIHPSSSIELGVRFDYHYGAGEYTVSGIVNCSEDKSNELSTTVQATH